MAPHKMKSFNWNLPKPAASTASSTVYVGFGFFSASNPFSLESDLFRSSESSRVDPTVSFGFSLFSDLSGKRDWYTGGEEG